MANIGLARRRARSIHKPRAVGESLRNVRGAIDLASIMVGVLVIGIIGGVISATVFAVIPWSQDNAAKQSLDSVAVAESASKVLDGEYLAYDNHDDSEWRALEGDPGIERPDQRLIVDAGENWWIATIVSDTGRVFIRTHGTPDTHEVVEDKPADEWIVPDVVTYGMPDTYFPDVQQDIIDTAVKNTDPYPFPEGKPGKGGPAPTGGDTGGNPLANSLFLTGTDLDYNDYFMTVKESGVSSFAIAPGVKPNTDEDNAFLNGKLYVAGQDQTSYVWGLASYDGTTIKIEAETPGMVPKRITAYAGSIYYILPGGLYSFDGTTATLRAPVSGNSTADMVVMGGKLYYVSFDAVNGYELWSYDGTTAAMVSATLPGKANIASHGPEWLFATSDHVYMSAPTWISGTSAMDRNVYAYDGTGVPTTVLPGASGTAKVKYPAIFNDQLIVNANTDGNYHPVRVYGKTATVLTTDSQIDQVTTPSGVFWTSYDNYLWGYRAGDTTGVRLAAIPASIASEGWIDVIGAAGEYVYLDGYDNTVGNEIWVFDGTSFSAIDFTPGSNGSNLGNTVGYIGDTFYTKIDTGSGYALYALNNGDISKVGDFININNVG